MERKKSHIAYVLPVTVLIAAVAMEIAAFMLATARVSDPAVMAAGTAAANFSSTAPDVAEDADLPPEKIPDMLQEMVRQKDPSAAFAFVRAVIAARPHLELRCHGYVHDIGDAAFEKYGSFEEAMRYSDDFCGSGYVHSIISDLIGGTDDPTKVINGLCHHGDGFCFHGIGHGLMSFAENDVPRSLQLCSNLTDGDGKGRCSEGVFMQNFEDHQMYPTAYVYADDPLRLCREEKRYKSACYHYTGAYLAQGAKSGDGVFDRCDAADRDFRRKCISGMGAQMLAEHLDDVLAAVRLCDSGANPDVRDACMDGIVSYHLVSYQSLSKTQALCDSLSDADRKSCVVAMFSRAADYQP